jgi:hypothetical protein
MNKTIYKITAMKFEDPKDGEAKLTAKYKELHGDPPPPPPALNPLKPVERCSALVGLSAQPRPPGDARAWTASALTLCFVGICAGPFLGLSADCVLAGRGDPEPVPQPRGHVGLCSGIADAAAAAAAAAVSCNGAYTPRPSFEARAELAVCATPVCACQRAPVTAGGRRGRLKD